MPPWVKPRGGPPPRGAFLFMNKAGRILRGCAREARPIYARGGIAGRYLFSDWSVRYATQTRRAIPEGEQATTAGETEEAGQGTRVGFCPGIFQALEIRQGNEAPEISFM